MDTDRYHVGVTAVPYDVEREAGRETIDLSLTPEMELLVRAPDEVSDAVVEAALDDRRAWLLDSLYGLAERPDPRLAHDFTNGEKLLYGGKKHRLRVSEGAVETPELAFDGTRFVLRVPADADTAMRRRAVVDWYASHAADVLPACVDEVAGDRPTPPVSVTESGRRWVRVDDGLTVHWRLVLAPREVAAYVAVHALVRADHDPADPAFWTAIESLVPDYRSRREWLRHNGARLSL